MRCSGRKGRASNRQQRHWLASIGGRDVVPVVVQMMKIPSLARGSDVVLAPLLLAKGTRGGRKQPDCVPVKVWEMKTQGLKHT